MLAPARVIPQPGQGPPVYLLQAQSSGTPQLPNPFSGGWIITYNASSKSQRIWLLRSQSTSQNRRGGGGDSTSVSGTLTTTGSDIDNPQRASSANCMR